MSTDKNLIERMDDMDFPEMIKEFLDLPDEIFLPLRETVLEQLIIELSNPKTRLLMLEDFYGSGLNSEDLEENYVNLVEEIGADDTIPESRKQFLIELATLLFGSYNSLLKGDIHQKELLVEICRDRGDLPLPTYMTEGSSGMDVYALEDYEILPGESVLIPTGLKVSIPPGYELQVRDKSGIALKTKLRVANAPGTVDSDYRGEVGVIVENIEAPIADIAYEFTEEGRPIITSILHGKPYVIEKGTRFAQLVLTQILLANWTVVESVDSSDRGEGAYGSTGLE